MNRCLLVVTSVLLVGIPLAAQESLWSGTMTAEATESPLFGAVVGYNRNPAILPTSGEMDDPEFDFGGTTYTVYSLVQAERHPVTEDEWTIAFAITPPPGPDLESMTLTLDGKALRMNDALELLENPSDDPPWTGVAWTDPGFRWTDAQRVDAELTMAQPVPALPLAAAGLLASWLVLAAYRRAAGRTRRAS